MIFSDVVGKWINSEGRIYAARLIGGRSEQKTRLHLRFCGTVNMPTISGTRLDQAPRS